LHCAATICLHTVATVALSTVRVCGWKQIGLANNGNKLNPSWNSEVKDVVTDPWARAQTMNIQK